MQAAAVRDGGSATRANLISFSGLPGTGKSTVARKLASRLGAVWLRVDTIEQAILESGVLRGGVEEAGYRAAYRVAEDNLRLGLSVVADCANDCMLARDAWRDVGLRAGAAVVEIEVICSGVDEHRRRVETRVADVPGLSLPSWQGTIGRKFEPWNRARFIVDTAKRSADHCVAAILAAL